MAELLQLAILGGFCALLYQIWLAQGTREIALAAARKHLAQEGLQLLDAHVAQRAVWLKRDPRGQLRFWRRYHFEFSANGDERYQGKIIMLGNRVEQIHLQPHHFPDHTLH
jgi:hypothetical protein